jgi:hypothetical protein
LLVSSLVLTPVNASGNPLLQPAIGPTADIMQSVCIYRHAHANGPCIYKPNIYSCINETLTAFSYYIWPSPFAAVASDADQMHTYSPVLRLLYRKGLHC